MGEFKMKQSKIGSIHDNKIKDIDFAKLALQLNVEIRNLGKAGKPKTPEEMENRIDSYFALCQSFGLPPTVERFGTFYELRQEKSIRDWTGKYETSVHGHCQKSEGLYMQL